MTTAPNTGWQPIDTAPKDGAAIQVKIPGNGSDNIIAWLGGLLDAEGNDCGGWQFVEDQQPPECWTNGICWEVNEDGVPSVKPTHWRSLPPPPETEKAALSLEKETPNE